MDAMASVPPNVQGPASAGAAPLPSAQATPPAPLAPSTPSTPNSLDMSNGEGRSLRQSTKERKHYTDEPLNDEDIEGRRTFSLEERLTSDIYCAEYCQKFDNGEKFNLKYIQEHGLMNPILFTEKTGLGMRVPSKNFKVSDVKQCVGSRRHLDVMDVNTQKGLEMTMKDWVRYYENPNRDRLLNVISLEFSHTKLETYVESPTVVRQIDWVDCVWPRHLKECQTESTNLIDRMKYPKVQKYCLMSVKGCYTDFHIDFGGTSVWYHILHGEKIFWLIPPTDANIKLYEDWVLSGKQGDMFLGDQVPGCQRITLVEGNTFMIPTGWIHAVFTPEDSLVFGGNFLHSFNIPMQVKCSEVEDRTHVPGKFRYPFLGEILWYVLDRYVACIRGKSYRTLSAGELKKKQEDAEKAAGIFSPSKVKKSDDSKTTSPAKSEAKPLTQIDTLKAAAVDPEISSSLEQLLAPNINAETGEIIVEPAKPAPTSPRVIITSVQPTSMEVDVQNIARPPGGVESAKAGEMQGSQNGQVSVDTAQQAQLLKSSAPVPQNGVTQTTPSGQISTQVAPPISVPLAANAAQPINTSTLGAGDAGQEPKRFTAPTPIVHEITTDSTTPGGGDATDAPLTVLHIPDDTETSVTAPPTPMLSPALAPAPVKPMGSKFLTKFEIEGLKCLIKYLEDTPPQKVPLPKDINEPQALLRDAKELLAEHENDDQNLAICGEPTIFWPGVAKPMKQRGPKPGSTKTPKTPKVPKDKADKDPNSSVRRRRTRCKKCEACTRQDCGECHFCKDMRKFGGMGRMKQSCISRQCMAPVLPNTAMCCICQKEEHIKGQPGEEAPTTLMECGICWEIVHPQCLIEKYENLDNNGNTNEDLPNSWECPKCCHDGKRGQLKPRVPKGVSKIGKSEHEDGEVQIKQEVTDEVKPMEVDQAPSTVPYAPYQDLNLIKPRKPVHPIPPLPSTSTMTRVAAPPQAPKPPPNEFFIEPEPLPKRRKRVEEKPEDETDKKKKSVGERFVIRPAPIAPPNSTVKTNDDKNHPLDRTLWMRIFRYLGPHDLYSCLQVCKTFDRWCIDRSLWRTIDLSDRRLTKNHLIGVVRRQPSSLILAKCNVTSAQLQWLMCRLPLLRQLDLSYCSWSAVSALTMGSCPWLEKLRLDWVEGLGDDQLGYLLSSSSCHRPGVKDTGSRLRNMTELSLVGTDITGNSISYISHHLPSLVRLDLSHCPAVTTNSFDSPTKTPTFSQLNSVVLAGCRKLNSSILDFLNRLPGVKRVDLTGCSQITDAHIMLFNEANRTHPFRTLSGKILYRE